jgi:carbamoyltransferase
MKILGINAFGHDTSAALLIDGQLVAAVEEERLNREKHTRVFPYQSVKFCLDQGSISLEDIDCITYAYKPHLWLTHRFLYHQLRYFPFALGELRYAGRQYRKFIPLRRNLRKALNRDIPVAFIKHHDAHIGSTYLVSPFDKAAILTVDGLGEYESCSLSDGYGNKIKRLQHVNFPHSLGTMYACITHFLGYIPEMDEGKTMGLSAYGDPDAYYKEFKKIVRLNGNGSYSLDLSYFMYHLKRDTWLSDKFYRIFGPRRQSGEEISDRHRAVTAAAQRVLEETILHITEHLHKKTKQTAICVAGGVALNCVTNGMILDQGYFKDVFIQPASGDNGLPIGSAFYYYNVIMGKPRRYVASDTYLGPAASEDEITAALEKYKLPVKKSANAAADIASLLTQKKVIGLLQGRMEFGPRALGNRSILADPRYPDMKDIVNNRVKFREPFRPFAPSVHAERCKEYFENDYPSPYMLLVYKVKPDKKKIIPSIVHEDQTGRVQTVLRDVNPMLYEIIKEFDKLTSVPVILNTSFNIKGEPIVCSAEDAVRCFLGTNLDVLVLENYIIKKDDLNLEDYGPQENYRHH